MWHKWGCHVGCVERLERIRLEMKNIRENVGVTSVIDKIVENKFRWFEHVERKHVKFCCKESKSDGEKSNN